MPYLRFKCKLGDGFVDNWIMFYTLADEYNGFPFVEDELAYPVRRH